MGPGIARLAVQHPVLISDMVRVEYAVPGLERIALREIVANEGGVDRAVDHDMGHVHAHRSEFTRHALRQRTQRVLGARKGGEVGRSAQR